MRSLIHSDLFQSGVGQTRAELRAGCWKFRTRQETGSSAWSTTVWLPPQQHVWTEDKRVPEIPGGTGLVWGGLCKRPWVSLSMNQNSNRRIPVGKGGAKGRAMLSHWLPPGQLPSLFWFHSLYYSLYKIMWWLQLGPVSSARRLWCGSSQDGQ